MRWLREIPTGIIFTKKSVVSIYFELVKSSTPISFNDTHTHKHTHRVRWVHRDPFPSEIQGKRNIITLKKQDKNGAKIKRVK